MKNIQIEFRGPKGAGKTLIAKLIKSQLENCGIKVDILFQEPEWLVISPLTEDQIQEVLYRTRLTSRSLMGECPSCWEKRIVASEPEYVPWTAKTHPLDVWLRKKQGTQHNVQKIIHWHAEGGDTGSRFYTFDDLFQNFYRVTETNSVQCLSPCGTLKK